MKPDGKIDFSLIGDPFPHARTALRNLKKLGAVIHVVSGRCDPKAWGLESAAEQLENITNWLRKYRIPFDTVGATKPGWACVLVDDRALQFNGDWVFTKIEILRRRDAFSRLCANGHHVKEVNSNGKPKETRTKSKEEIRTAVAGGRLR